MQTRVLNCGENTITYSLTRKKVKNINLSIKAGEVRVSANFRTSFESVDSFVISKSDWIIKHVKKFSENKFDIAVRQFSDGERYLYMGNFYTLLVQKSDKEYVGAFGNNIVLAVKNPDNLQRKKDLLRKWYKSSAKSELSKIFRNTLSDYSDFFCQDYTLKIIDMTARWGSCLIGKKTVVLNSKLIYAPKNCIEYVVLHELVHFKFANHDKKFYAMLAGFLPDWKESKKILDNKIITYCRQCAI